MSRQLGHHIDAIAWMNKTNAQTGDNLAGPRQTFYDRNIISSCPSEALQDDFQRQLHKRARRVSDAQFLTRLPKRTQPLSTPVPDPLRDGQNMSLENTNSTYSNDEIFRELEEYCWEEDPEFQSGLSSIISNASDPEQVRSLTKQAKCYFYSRKIGYQIDFDEYNSWLYQQENQPDLISGQDPQEHQSPAAATTPVDLIPTKQTLANDHSANTTTTTTSSSSPQAQSSDSTIANDNTTIEAKSATTVGDAAITTSTDADKEDEKAPYPMSFAHIVELITTGKPIPGIKQIPDTLHGEEASTVSAKAPRRKPWETTLAETQAQT